MTMILALDPGTAQTGWALYDPGTHKVEGSGVAHNADLVRELAHYASTQLAIEMIASYGMAVGREVFETCVWIGRFQQAWHEPEAVRLVYRREVKEHLCGTSKAKDSNVRQALIDLFPPTGGGAVRQIGTKAQPGPLYGVSTHAWPALGVAVTAERHRARDGAHAPAAPAGLPGQGARIPVGPEAHELRHGGQVSRVPRLRHQSAVRARHDHAAEEGRMVGRMTPQYPDIDKPPLDVEVQAVIDPRYYVGREKGGERTMLLLFSEAHGWLTYALPEASALKIALQLQATALHQEISQQRHGAA